MFAKLGIARTVDVDIYTQSDGGSIMAFIQFGALVTLVGYTLWTARAHLRATWIAVLRPETGYKDDFSMRGVYLLLIVGLVLSRRGPSWVSRESSASPVWLPCGRS
jgi:hypothetical protein